MRNRILTLVNLLLVLVCGGCVWYLTTKTSERPQELDEAAALLSGNPTPTPASTGKRAETFWNPATGRVETRYVQVALPPPVKTPVPTPVISPTPEANLQNLSKGMFVPIATATPTPTPSPTPTPAPPDLGTAVQVWKITSMDADVVEFLDPRGNSNQGETFTLKVGGPPRQSPDKDNRMVDVSLISVDMDNGLVTLGYQGQTMKKSMLEGQ